MSDNKYVVFRVPKPGHTLSYYYVYHRMVSGTRIAQNEWEVARAAVLSKGTLQQRVRQALELRESQGLPECELDITKLVRQGAARARQASRMKQRAKAGKPAPAVTYHERALRIWASRRARAEARRKHILALRAVGAAPDPFADEIDT